MEEKPEIYCLKCEKLLHRSVCVVEDAGLVTIDFTYLSKYYGGFRAKSYICDDCFEKNPKLFL